MDLVGANASVTKWGTGDEYYASYTVGRIIEAQVRDLTLVNLRGVIYLLSLPLLFLLVLHHLCLLVGSIIIPYENIKMISLV